MSWNVIGYEALKSEFSACFFFLIFPSRVVLVSNEDRTKQHGEKGREPKRGSTNQNGTSINGADRNSPGPSGNFFLGQQRICRSNRGQVTFTKQMAWARHQIPK